MHIKFRGSRRWFDTQGRSSAVRKQILLTCSPKPLTVELVKPKTSRGVSMVMARRANILHTTEDGSPPWNWGQGFFSGGEFDSWAREERSSQRNEPTPKLLRNRRRRPAEPHG